MNFGLPIRLEAMLRGSCVDFKTRNYQFNTEQRELATSNKQVLQGGIYSLRSMRNLALTDPDVSVQQSALRDAHRLCEVLAQSILGQEFADSPFPIAVDTRRVLGDLHDKYKKIEPATGYSLPAQFSIGNLHKAGADIRLRIEERAKSITDPDHKLTTGDVAYVLHEFFEGANLLSIDAREHLYNKKTCWGGILSGGGVYTEMARQVINRYSCVDLKMPSFVIAVDKNKERSVCEIVPDCDQVKAVILLDDIINDGATMFAALNTVGAYFPRAEIHSGSGMDEPGSFERRRVSKHKDHLELLFQNFADLAQANNKTGAMQLFNQAQEYASQNGVTLQPGWYKRKAKLGIQ